MNRNLVIVKTFNDFAQKLNDIDFNTEDIAALVTDLNNVLYGINIESIWGAIGFTWNIVDNRGVFNRTTVPFSIIPKVPDGERIQEFNNTFNNISTIEFKVVKSNWENLRNLYNLCPNGKQMTVDFTDAPLDGTTRYLIASNSTQGTSLYIKGNFKNATITGGDIAFGTRDSYVENSPELIIDDNNKYLNFPLDSSTTPPRLYGCYIHWKGTGPWKSEYMWYNINGEYEIGQNYIKSDSNQYYITLAKGTNNQRICDRPQEIIHTIPTEEEKGIELTIDCTYNKDVRLSEIFNPIRVDNQHGSSISNSSFIPYKVDSLNIIGEYNSIDWYMPYRYIKDSYPEFDSDMASKLVDGGDNDHYCEIYRGIIFGKLLMANNQTIDVSNIDYIRLFYYFKFLHAPLTEQDAIDLEGIVLKNSDSGFNNRTCYALDIFPKFDTEHKFKNFVGPETGPRYNYNSQTNNIALFWKVPNVYTDYFSVQGGAIMDDTVIRLSGDNNWKNYTPNYIETFDKIHFIYHPYEDGTIYINGYASNYGCTSPKGDINYIALEDNVTNEILKASIINTIAVKPAYGYAVKHPFIICNNTVTIKLETQKYIIDSDKIFIYGSNISIKDKHENNMFDDVTLQKILDGLQVNDTGKNLTVTVREILYNKLTEEQKSSIIDKGYTINVEYI